METDLSEPYNYNALYVGIIILSFGVGSIVGSVIGGKLSDVVLRRLKKANGGIMVPEVSGGEWSADSIQIDDRCVCTVRFLPCRFWLALFLRTLGRQGNMSMWRG
jgi:MFS family permease